MLATSSGVAQLSQRLRRTESDMPNDTTGLSTLTKEIPLTQGKVAIVDAEDYALVSQFKWLAHRNARNWYCSRSVARGARHLQQTLSIHTLLMKPPRGFQVDHKNGDGLDNRRSNLRVVTTRQNSLNRKRQKNNTSGFKGVRLCVAKKGPRWEASIALAKKRYYLGLHDTAEGAARTYDQAAKRLHGEFAQLNFPEGEQA